MKQHECTHTCDACLRKGLCQELFVLREILKDELRYLDDESLRARIFATFAALERGRYHYPYAVEACCLSQDVDEAERIFTALQGLLLEVRLQLASRPS